LEPPKIPGQFNLMSASLKIKNPNATAACGCGTSFSV
jgi:Fe-S cluster assembly iron-binding protein IscA